MKQYTPTTFVKDSVRDIPAVKYAVGIGGIVSIIGLLLSIVSPRVGGWGALIMLVLMVALLVFSALVKLAKNDSRTLYYPALIMLWTFVILTCATSCTLFSCVFFQKPVDLQEWLTGVHKTANPPETQLTMEAAEAQAAEQDAEIEALRLKGPPFGYRLTENCTVAWTNFMGKRIWVKDPQGITGGAACPSEPLGIFIEEDHTHYYDAGTIKAVTTEVIPSGCYPHVDGVCAANPSRVKVGQAVTFQVWGYGGTGEYAFTWSGENGILSGERSLVTTFSKPGINVVKVQITSNGQNIYKECRVIVYAD